MPVAIGGATDDEGDALTLAITSIRQDEPVGKGNWAPDGKGIGAATAELRAEKLGSGNGRFYHVSFTGSDGHGGACTGVVRVEELHDQAKPAVDGGPLYDSRRLERKLAGAPADGAAGGKLSISWERGRLVAVPCSICRVRH